MKTEFTAEDWAEIERNVDPSKICFGSEGTYYDPVTGEMTWVVERLCELSPYCH